MDLVVGVDFDNTIVDYDALMHSIAVQWGLISPHEVKSKQNIRDKIRKLTDGEIKWQKLQGIVYGPKMEEAQLIDGVKDFFQLCKSHKTPIYIISHKTEFANYDETQTNLRKTAITWMRKNYFFKADGLGLSENDVYFESTRLEKIKCIQFLKCTHFIDDLEETFLEKAFPVNIEKLLFTSHKKRSQSNEIQFYSSWEQIRDHFFK